MKKTLFLSFFLLMSVFALAQNGANSTGAEDKKVTTPKKKTPKQDGYIYKTSTEADTVVPYAKVNREDVVYTKRVWREIDLRDRGNQILNSPKENLVGIIYDAINNGELDLYPSNIEDWSVDPLSAKKGNNPKATSSSVADTAFLGVNPSTNEVNRANNEFFKASFVAIRVKEDWILDIKRGIFEPRIIGIAPVRIDVKQAVDNNGNPVTDPVTGKVRADTVRFLAGWINFEDLREILVKHKIANNQNDNSGINFDDVFVRRLFYSNITKMSNSEDNRIEDILFNSKDRLLESERYKKAMADFEQGLWEY
jgi:gliding motility associated protien GldN